MHKQIADIDFVSLGAEHLANIPCSFLKPRLALVFLALLIASMAISARVPTDETRELAKTIPLADLHMHVYGIGRSTRVPLVTCSAISSETTFVGEVG